jgi:5,5'-dehydrodivanillate O-demethylase
MIRKRFFDDIERIERGEDPKAIVRDPAANERINLPIPVRAIMEDGLTRQEMLNHAQATSFQRYIFQAGQPDEIRRAYEAAMGFEAKDEKELLLEIASFQANGRRPAPTASAAGD